MFLLGKYTENDFITKNPLNMSLLWKYLENEIIGKMHQK